MKDMKKGAANNLVYLLVLFACGTLTGELQAQSGSYPPDILQKIRQVEEHLAPWAQPETGVHWTLAERMAYHHLQGLSMAVVHNFKIDWAKGYGWADSAAGRPVTTTTLFQAASISKSLNGVGVLKLVQDGLLDLNVDINHYLPADWKFPYDSLSKNKKITIANLLSHTAGLSVHGFAGYARGDSIPDIYQILNGNHPANSAAIRSLFEPGLRSEYSGGGITVSQLIVTNTTGEAYDKYMQEKVLGPLGMTSSSYRQPPSADRQSILATGYKASGRELTGKYHIYPEQAAAGLWTNPTDLCRYIIETQLAIAGKSDKVLSRPSTILRLTPYIDSNAALGVFITQKGDIKYFQHGGANEGFRCQYYGGLSNDGNGVVVMVNSDNGAILEEIINSVATVYEWKGFYTPVIKHVTPVAAEILQTYTGRYLIREDTIRVVNKGGTLYLDPGYGAWQLYFTSPVDCFAYDDRAAFHFIKEADGRISGIRVDDRVTLKRID
jgi:CubicO group peptidase (beta-lactamase class C family)